MISPVARQASQIDIPVSIAPMPVEFFLPKGHEATSTLEWTKVITVPSDSEKEVSEATITIRQAVLRRGQPSAPAAKVVRKLSEPPKDKLVIEVTEKLHEPAPIRYREAVRAPQAPQVPQVTTVTEEGLQDTWSPERKDVIRVKETIESTWDRLAILTSSVDCCCCY